VDYAKSTDINNRNPYNPRNSRLNESKEERNF